MLPIGKSILIVDDDQSVQFVIKKRLKASGFECHSAMTVEEGLEQMRTVKPDLILLDLGFAGVDGADFLQSARHWLNPGENVPPIIVMSCYNEKDIIEYVKHLGAAEFLPKPYDPQDLLACVHEHMG